MLLVYMAKNTVVFNKIFVSLCIFCVFLFVLFLTPLLSKDADSVAMAKSPAKKNHKQGESDEWINMPDGAKPAFAGVQGGTAPAVSAHASKGNSTNPGSTVNNFLQAIRGEDRFDMSAELEHAEGGKSASDNMASLDNDQKIGAQKGAGISFDGLGKILNSDYNLSGIFDESELGKKI